MSAQDKISELIGDLEKTVNQIEKLEAFYQNIKNDRLDMLIEKSYDLILLADIFADFYTCVETAFVRISKYFENNLDNTKWHSHLLDKMTIDIPSVRKRVLSENAEKLLREFLRFRHFKRYYFEFEYDRDRIDFLEKKFNQVIPLIKKDIAEFQCFLNELSENLRNQE